MADERIFGRMFGGLPPLGNTIVGFTTEGRPAILNQPFPGQSRRDPRSISTERSATRRFGDVFVNFPTIFGGREFTEDDAFEIIRQNDFIDPETGRQLEFFQTEKAAIAAAKKRSKSIKVRRTLGDRRVPSG